MRTVASTDGFDVGPYNWARARIVKLAEPDVEGNTYRVTLAFDTKIFPNRADVAYLAGATVRTFVCKNKCYLRIGVAKLKRDG